jgi:hypothetical protein
MMIYQGKEHLRFYGDVRGAWSAHASNGKVYDPREAALLMIQGCRCSKPSQKKAFWYQIAAEVKFKPEAY